LLGTKQPVEVMAERNDAALRKTATPIAPRTSYLSSSGYRLRGKRNGSRAPAQPPHSARPPRRPGDAPSRQELRDSRNGSRTGVSDVWDGLGTATPRPYHAGLL
jgi:hypothetical protein